MGDNETAAFKLNKAAALWRFLKEVEGAGGLSLAAALNRHQAKIGPCSGSGMGAVGLVSPLAEIKIEGLGCILYRGDF